MTTQRLVRADDVVVEDLDGELLLLRRGAYEAAHLDGVASAMWRMLEQPVTHEQLVTAMADAFGVDAERVRADIGPALALLREHALLLEVE